MTAQRKLYALLIVLSCYTLLSIIVLAATPQIVLAMTVNPEHLVQTSAYIRLEAIGITIGAIATYGNTLLLLANRHKAIIGLAIIRCLALILADTLLVSHYSCSLQLGVNWVAWANICVNLILSLTLALMVFTELNPGFKHLASNITKQRTWLKQWLSIGCRSGLESFVRNTAFIIMILQMVNRVNEAGTFWLTNQFIWSWLLLPVLALGKVIQRDAACHAGLSPQRIIHYAYIMAGIVLLWLVSIPSWPTALNALVGQQQAVAVMRLLLIMLGFYIVFAFNQIIDSYFYGVGRTDMMLYQSLLVNIGFYGVVYILYQHGIFIPSLNGIAVMFGIGITLDAIITLLLYLYLQRHQHKASRTSVL
ncbi:MATE family Na+-driven efflux transporter [Shewanella sp. NFH-SH190041]|uniref:MATE family Na+-driven efflux transporter n=1 Tax=Shewanella sp. NFH-SH190041 TaxID=2950245 RepID=UPI003965CD58